MCVCVCIILMKNTALKLILNHGTLNKFQHQRHVLVNCFMQQAKNYWLAIANLVQILGQRVFLNHFML